MTDGRPCGKKDGHKGRHSSIEAIKKFHNPVYYSEQHARHREQRNCDSREWYAQHREYANENRREYYAQHREQSLAYARERIQRMNLQREIRHLTASINER